MTNENENLGWEVARNYYIPVMALSATLSLSAKAKVRHLLSIFSPSGSLDVSVPLDRPEIFITQVDVVNLLTGGWESVRRVVFVPVPFTLMYVCVMCVLMGGHSYLTGVVIHCRPASPDPNCRE